MKLSIFKLSPLVILILFWACAAKKTDVTEIADEDLQPKLIFLNYSISNSENNKKNIEFISKTITDGKLKSSSNKYIKVGGIGDLKCRQLNKDSVEINAIAIKNPLSKIIEFVNDSLIFENKLIELKKAPLSLRLQLHSETKFIAIEEITDSLQKSKTLIITKLD
ncbi:hypothetical protein [Mariniflexile sp.]|uniref:hypothetical protein n=1 Tax=Mariniflexile sp. TaxID=1979402 RepID=UPI0035645CF9